MVTRKRGNNCPLVEKNSCFHGEGGAIISFFWFLFLLLTLVAFWVFEKKKVWKLCSRGGNYSSFSARKGGLIAPSLMRNVSISNFFFSQTQNVTKLSSKNKNRKKGIIVSFVKTRVLFHEGDDYSLDHFSNF